MKKISKLIAVVLSVAVVAGMATNAYAADIVQNDTGVYTGKIQSNGFYGGAKMFLASTSKIGTTNSIMTAGIAVDDYYSGQERSKNFKEANNVTYVDTSCGVSPYASSRVTVFGSHSAYHNGQQKFYEFTEQSYDMT